MRGSSGIGARRRRESLYPHLDRVGLSVVRPDEANVEELLKDDVHVVEDRVLPGHEVASGHRAGGVRDRSVQMGFSPTLRRLAH